MSFQEIIHSDHHAFALEWSAPAPERLITAHRDAATERGIALYVSLFTDTVFSIQTARAVHAEQTQKLAATEEKLIVVSARSFLTEAQNVLLKSLEEPSIGVRLIIITPSLASLLDTVLSRTMPLSITSETPTNNSQKVSGFLSAPLRDRLATVASVLGDETKQTQIELLESLEFDLTREITSRSNDLALIRAGKKVLEAKKAVLSGSTTIKYLLEELALTLPHK